ncbi:hypothetical protein I6A62_32870 [Frankia sp. AgW1.1]|nr:hypothetical protein [Frankia sp. AgB1.8]MBL7492791.1 hypothetical protein [Frankia sp. AgW1.1]MBL7619254.1 hypothetical protein [Frankia sp. AgB1.8]
MQLLSLIISLVSVLVAVVVAVWGFRSSSRSERLRMFFDLQERYLSEPVRVGRRLIHTAIAGNDHVIITDIPRETLSSIGYTLAVMNTIAICTEVGYVDEALIARSMGRSFATAVYAALPYIDHVESVRGFRPYPYAERFAARLRA